MANIIIINAPPIPMGASSDSLQDFLTAGKTWEELMPLLYEGKKDSKK